MPAEEYVVFDRGVCAGLVRRVLILLVDGAGVALAGSALESAGAGGALSWVWWGIVFVFLEVERTGPAAL